MEQLEKIKEIEKLQKNVMELAISDNMIIDENIRSNTNENEDNQSSDNDGFPNIKGSTKKRKRISAKNKAKDINKIRDTNNLDDVYEIEKIIDHKVEDKNYKFYIKWKGYSNDYNSLISISAFNEKDMLKEYLTNKSILIQGINL